MTSSVESTTAFIRRVSAWRVDERRRLSASFTGYGAAKYGGRWNSREVPAVYVSEHLAMAASEKFVHLARPIPVEMEFVKFRLDFRKLAITRINTSSLPSDWNVEPLQHATQEMGDAWLLGLTTAILAVPSALYPEETNFLLNPGHPDFRKIRISAPEPFSFDPRMGRLRDASPPPRGG